MFKKIITVVVATSLIFVSSTHASSLEQTELLTPNPIVDTQELYTAEGDYLGSVVSTTTIEKVSTFKGIEYILTEVKDYELAPAFSRIDSYVEKFADKTNVTTFLVKNDQTILINGELIPIKDQTITPPKFPRIGIYNDTGGVSSISHYYSTSDYQSYAFATYNDIKWSGVKSISPTGQNVSKSGIKRNNSFFQDAKASIDSFENNYDNYQMNITITLIEMGVAGVTIVGIITAIVAAGAAAVSATLVWNAWNGMKEDLSDAYSYVYLM